MKKMDNFNWTPIREKIYKQLKAGKDVVSVMKSVPCTESAVYLVNAAMKQGFLPQEEVERFSPVNNLFKNKPLTPPSEEIQREMEREIEKIIGPTKPNERLDRMDPFGGNLTRRAIVTDKQMLLEAADKLKQILLEAADRDALEFELAKIRNQTAKLNLEFAEMQKKLEQPTEVQELDVESWREHIAEVARVHEKAGYRSWTEHVASELTISDIVEILINKLGLEFDRRQR